MKRCKRIRWILGGGNSSGKTARMIENLRRLEESGEDYVALCSSETRERILAMGIPEERLRDVARLGEERLRDVARLGDEWHTDHQWSYYGFKYPDYINDIEDGVAAGVFWVKKYFDERAAEDESGEEEGCQQ